MGSYSEKARAWEDEKLDSYIDTLEENELKEEDYSNKKVEVDYETLADNIREKASELKEDIKLASSFGLDVGETSLVDFLFDGEDISFETIEIWKNF
jgi:uncharacterized GH25 family protein